MANQSVNVRRAFRARPGYYFLDLDYSQIEFRLSAAMAGERPLVIGLKEGKDYYKMVYALAYAKALDEVTKTERQLGKVVALGQNYGQEHWGLAHKLGISNDEAKAIMEAYWSGQPMTKQAKEAALEEAYKLGGTFTYFGRFRPLPDLFIQGNSREERGRRNKAVRSVWNTKVQGTAADWIKIAMVRVNKALAGRDAHMLLTVHDELLFEVSFDEPLYEIVEIVKKAMEFKVKGLPKGCEDIYPDGFFVPTDPEFGLNWGELYPLNDKIDKETGKPAVDKKTGKEAIGFLTYLQRNNIAVNLNAPRPDIDVSFIARPVRNAIVNVPERVKPQVEGKPDKKASTTLKVVPMSAEHPLDQLLAAFVRKGVVQLADSPPPQLSVVPNAQLAVQQTMNLDPNPVATPNGEPGFVQVARVMPEPLEMRVNVAVDPSEPITVPKPPNPFIEVPVPAPTPKVEVMPVAPPGQQQNDLVPKDITYPCMMLTVHKGIDEKAVQFLKALAVKYPGDFRCYLVYRGQTIVTSLKIDSGDVVKQYLRKAFGDDSKLDLFDDRGRQLGRVSFS